ncbi:MULTISPECIES: o-succinylbenzoate synthase [unclassified Microcoleus]|uniref:o-succinylbenzoate synthase n=1 Tax=unclassified Microcoleus TaxID=2642155 RepID=UPI001DDC14A1|nr:MULTISPECIES: o-succinylbenzoate synthase [unclassified Microcoleus]MCC3503732.1 o-succinylbenzoate synthase [Microcoleus sp. PH2017_19_SFW_U_A]MCC3524087.1 o-succinylbenzoate synthase [Microcoleus sp. PH2017_20_SFW_D_A]MCC3554427.1 o-succinylbenzoate synthase [Microcoleus sp. PH2017_35_SFW_U_B]TAG94514.1 MAG: o-succinylbenzoate synthase [Oscillatoriales cyanobacterium]
MLYKFEFRTYQRKFKRPLQTSHGIWDMREGIILRLIDENGRICWGEIAPLSWFGSETFDQALDFCQQLPANISEEIIFSISAELPACQFGFESAWENLGQAIENTPRQDKIPKNQCSGLLPAGETALQVLPMLWLEGYRTFKWKIGVAVIEEELTIFQQLIAAMDDLADRQTALLRLDANGGLTYSQAEKWLEACDSVTATPDLAAQIEFLEQPLAIAQFPEMVRLNATYTTAIALDESAANLDRIQECYNQGWRGIFVIKPAIGGSPSQLRKFCQTHNIDAVFSSVFETKIGRQAALNLATKLSLNNRALGFGTDSWFDDNQDTWLQHLWQKISQ